MTRTLLLAAALATAAAGAAEPRVPLPDPPRGKGDACVEPVEVMRREHMDMLLVQRDATVHHGERGAKHSLAGCVDCHAVPAPGGGHLPVDAPGQFCADCHAYAAVRIDCFQCHATVPAGSRAAPADGGREPLLDRISRALFGAAEGER